MSNWAIIKLGDYYDFSSGLSKAASEFGSGYPFLSFSNVFWNYFVPEELTELVNTTKKERESCSVKKGDIFLTRTSETADELGMSCVALKDYPEATFNGFTKRLRPKLVDKIDPVFIGFYLRSPYFRAQVSSYSNIITRASLNNDILERLKIKIPSFKIQKKIGEILLNYNKLIENNNQRIMLLEEMAEEIYKEWFVRLRFPGYEKTKIVDGVPDGWEKKRLGDLLKQIKRKPKVRKDEYIDDGKFPIIDQGENIIAGYISDEKYVQKEPLPLVVFGDHTRRVKFVDFPFAAGADGTQLLSPLNENLVPVYFYQAVKNVDLSNFHYSRHFKFLKQEYILEPEDFIAKQYNQLVYPFFKEIDILRLKNKTLQKTRDLLLPRLISGKLSIENLDIDITKEKEILDMAAEPKSDYN